MESPVQLETKPLEDSGVGREYLFRLYKQALEAHIEAAFGWREAEQRDRFETSYPSPEISVLFMASTVAGYLAVRNSPSRKHVALLLLEPEYQRRGLGKTIMKTIHEEAIQSSQDVTLSSFKSNLPALAFYQALGYRLLLEDTAFIELRWEKETSNQPLNARPRVKHAAH